MPPACRWRLTAVRSVATVVRARFAIFAVLAVLIAAAPAGAAFPGHNGKIAFSASPGAGFNDVYSVNPDGTGRADLTNTGGNDRTPAWSPDGARIAFASMRDGNFEIYVMNADGTGQTRVTNDPATDIDPAWDPTGDFLVFTSTRDGNSEVYITNLDGSLQTRITNHTASDGEAAWSPDGRRIAFVSDRVRNFDYDLFTMKPDGTDLRQVPLPNAPGECWVIGPDFSHPDWSPTGERLVFANNGDEECIAEEQVGRIETVRPDGSGRQAIVDDLFNVQEPAWSPDGTRVVYVYPGANEIRTVDSANGGNRQTVTTGDAPDWQPVPGATASTYVRPKGATPFRIPLVPAAQPCTAPNRQHGPPLAYGSCNPVVPESPHATVSQGNARLRSTGFVRLDVLPGVPTPPDDSDVRLGFSLTNVMNASDFSDYAGELRARLTVRLTDRVPGSFSQTTQDFQFATTVPCATTPASALDGSDCQVVTSFMSLVPGSIKDTARAIWALDAVQVDDGGADDDADTEGDNSLFATQGIFVP